MPVLIKMAIPFNPQVNEENQPLQINPSQNLRFNVYIKILQLVLGLLSLCLFYFGSEDSGEKVIFVMFGMGLTFPGFVLIGLVDRANRKAIYFNYFSSFLMFITGSLCVFSWIHSQYIQQKLFYSAGNKIDIDQEILKFFAGVSLIINSIIYLMESFQLTLKY